MFTLIEEVANEALDFLESLQEEKSFSDEQKEQLKNVSIGCRDLIRELVLEKSSPARLVVRSKLMMDKQYDLGLLTGHALELSERDMEKSIKLLLATQTVSFALGITHLNHY